LEGIKYGKLRTDARFSKLAKRKTDVRSATSAVLESAPQCLCILILQHQGKWKSFLSELMPLIEPYCSAVPDLDGGGPEVPGVVGGPVCRYKMFR